MNNVRKRTRSVDTESTLRDTACTAPNGSFVSDAYRYGTNSQESLKAWNFHRKRRCGSIFRVSGNKPVTCTSDIA